MSFGEKQWWKILPGGGDEKFSATRKALENREATFTTAEKEKKHHAEWNKKVEELRGLQTSPVQQGGGQYWCHRMRIQALQAAAEAREEGHWVGV